MVRMALKAGVEHPRDLGMRFKLSGDMKAGCAGALNAQEQGAQAPQAQIGVIG